jgi:pimeloyl-ACP methyl ester carboxylesterase
MMLRQTVTVFALLCLQGCSSAWVRLNNTAQQAGVTRHVVAGEGFTHTIFVKAAAHAIEASVDVVPVVFIEGDGLPWRNHGWQPNPDPRPLHALAFNLFLTTPNIAWYITRPCYDDSLATPACDSKVWTDARYSNENINSMAAALQRFAAQQQTSRLVLVGYSGGGALAVLLAARMPEVIGVVSIAANLDQQAWAQAHHYSPLIGSLNPATDTGDLRMPHVALHGQRDDNVPASTLTAFATSHPTTRWQYIDSYDHVCCWERDWPWLWPQTLHSLLAH